MLQAAQHSHAKPRRLAAQDKGPQRRLQVKGDWRVTSSTNFSDMLVRKSTGYWGSSPVVLLGKMAVLPSCITSGPYFDACAWLTLVGR